MSALPTVSIVIATWNGRTLLEPCLASIAGVDYPADALDVVVVDNGSKDDTVAWLAREHPAVRVLQNADNLGFAAASNQGADAAAGDVVAFVNNDVRLDPAWLRPLVEALGDDGVRAVGSRILDWDGRRYDFDGGAMSFDGHGVSPRHGHPYAPGAAECPSPTLFACGAAMAVERTAFLDAGGFDADYFAYFEDVDLGWRLWVQGARVLHVPQSVAFHRHHGSGIGSDRHLRLLERNALVSLVKNYDDANLARVEPAALALLQARAAAAAAYEETLAEFQAERAALDAKRAQVQGRRARPDDEILPLFREPFRPCMFGRDYFEMQQEIVQAHGIGDLFGGVTAGLDAFVGELQFRITELERELESATGARERDAGSAAAAKRRWWPWGERS